MPGGDRGGFGEVGELFDLCGQHSGFDDHLVALGGGAPSAGEDARAVAGIGATDMAPEHFALADQLGCEEGGPAAFACRAPEDQRIATVFDQRLRIAAAVERTHHISRAS